MTNAQARAPNSAHHVVQFYDREDHLYTTVADFLGSGLEAGEPAVVIATAEHRRGFCEELANKGVDVERSQGEGDLILLDARDSLAKFTVNGEPQWRPFRDEMGAVIEKSLNGGRRTRVRAYGEMVDLLWKDGQQDAALRLEEFWNDLGLMHRFSLLCAYALGNFYKEAHGGGFQQVCRCHDTVIPARSEALEVNLHSDAALREIAVLQQRARSLEHEVERRRSLEQGLREALTERRHAQDALARSEETLRTQNDKLEKALRAKDEFLAMLGHELRNPLAPIVTATQLMRLRGNESRELFVIERQVGHLVRLVDDLLDVSRITRGNIQLHPRPQELADVVVRAIETTSPLLEQRRHRLEVLVPHRGLGVEVDADRMTQVVSNLLNNAAKYSHPGSPIRVLGERIGSKVRLSIKDEGIGIAPEMIGTIFEMFVQEAQASDRAHGGLGIGLAIVKNLVELHGGTVSVSSAGLGAGSEFSIEIPARPLAVPENGEIALPRAMDTHLSGKKILVVDDNEDALELLAEALTDLGCNVVTACDGPSALTAARDFRPEIALLDVGLPIMDGYELAGHLRTLDETDPNMLLVAVSGYGQPRDHLRSRAAGFAQHLVKPVDLERLQDALRAGS